jgi:hypothetical protein
MPYTIDQRGTADPDAVSAGEPMNIHFTASETSGEATESIVTYDLGNQRIRFTSPSQGHHFSVPYTIGFQTQVEQTVTVEGDGGPATGVFTVLIGVRSQTGGPGSGFTQATFHVL